MEQFEELQWRLNWLGGPDQKANMNLANGLFEQGMRPSEWFYKDYVEGNADREVNWMSIDLGNACWSTCAKMIVPSLRIGTNWRATSGRRARFLCSCGVTLASQTGNIELERTMYCYFRSVYLLYAITCEGFLCDDGDQISDLKSVEDVRALLEARGLRPWALVPAPI